MKHTEAIIKFQAVKDDINKINLRIIVGEELFSHASKKTFIKKWRDLIGCKMELEIRLVDNIEVANSVKFIIVKNRIKHLKVFFDSFNKIYFNIT